MFFGKKRKYKLPKFPAGVKETFQRLATDLDEGELVILRTAIVKHFEAQQSEDSPTNNYSDIELAGLIEGRESIGIRLVKVSDPSHIIQSFDLANICPPNCY